MGNMVMKNVKVSGELVVRLVENSRVALNRLNNFIAGVLVVTILSGAPSMAKGATIWGTNANNSAHSADLEDNSSDERLTFEIVNEASNATYDELVQGATTDDNASVNEAASMIELANNGESIQKYMVPANETFEEKLTRIGKGYLTLREIEEWRIANVNRLLNSIYIDDLGNEHLIADVLPSYVETIGVNPTLNVASTTISVDILRNIVAEATQILRTPYVAMATSNDNGIPDHLVGAVDYAKIAASSIPHLTEGNTMSRFEAASDNEKKKIEIVSLAGALFGVYNVVSPYANGMNRSVVDVYNGVRLEEDIWSRDNIYLSKYSVMADIIMEFGNGVMPNINRPRIPFSADVNELAADLEKIWGHEIPTYETKPNHASIVVPVMDQLMPEYFEELEAAININDPVEREEGMNIALANMILNFEGFLSDSVPAVFPGMRDLYPRLEAPASITIFDGILKINNPNDPNGTYASEPEINIASKVPSKTGHNGTLALVYGRGSNSSTQNRSGRL